MSEREDRPAAAALRRWRAEIRQDPCMCNRSICETYGCQITRKMEDEADAEERAILIRDRGASR